MIPNRDSLLPSFRRFAIGFLLLGFLVSGAKGYDSPDFERETFDVDGLFLDGSSRDALLEALASVASNFPGDERVDSDLREKCLAISLRISPLHHNSRMAHDALMSGQNPPATTFFTSLPSASEAIWGVAERMGEKDAEPGARKLAPFLMEISLYLHPKPPKQRIELFADLTGKELLPWNDMVRLQPESNPSSKAALKLFDRLETWDQRKEDREAMETAGAGAGGPASPTSPAAGDDAPEVKLESVSMPFISSLIVRGDGVAGGLATLNIREAEPGEDDLFGLQKPDDDPARATQMQLVGDAAGIPPAGLRTVAETVRRKYPVWPQKMVAEIGFSTEEELSTPRAMMQADMTLPGSILLHSAFSGLPIDEDFIFCGSLGESAANKDSPILVEGRVGGILASGNLMDQPFLVLPLSSFDAILASVKETEDLSVLFSPQLIGVENFSEAIALAATPKPDTFLAATGSYLEIEEVASRMSLIDLAKNSKVQERLIGILEDYPNHLSAKVMLAYGRGE